jgi:hypothetical protein
MRDSNRWFVLAQMWQFSAAGKRDGVMEKLLRHNFVTTSIFQHISTNTW